MTVAVSFTVHHPDGHTTRRHPLHTTWTGTHHIWLITTGNQVPDPATLRLIAADLYGLADRHEPDPTLPLEHQDRP